MRDEIHGEVRRRIRRGAGPSRSPTAHGLDASLLLLPLVGFLPPDDPRIVGTVAAIERELILDGFVIRYARARAVDGLPRGEGVFLACCFWLADNLVLLGRRDEARELFERLLGFRNDVGLLAEEYDPSASPSAGNFPQAFSHVALVNTAQNLDNHGPMRQRTASEVPTRLVHGNDISTVIAPARYPVLRADRGRHAAARQHHAQVRRACCRRGCNAERSVPARWWASSGAPAPANRPCCA